MRLLPRASPTASTYAPPREFLRYTMCTHALVGLEHMKNHFQHQISCSINLGPSGPFCFAAYERKTVLGRILPLTKIYGPDQGQYGSSPLFSTTWLTHTDCCVTRRRGYPPYIGWLVVFHWVRIYRVCQPCSRKSGIEGTLVRGTLARNLFDLITNQQQARLLLSFQISKRSSAVGRSSDTA